MILWVCKVQHLFANRVTVALNPGLGYVRYVASTITSHEQHNQTESAIFKVKMLYFQIRAVTGQRSSPELSFANKIKMFFRAKKRKEEKSMDSEI